MPSSILVMLESWQGTLGNHRSRVVWGAASTCLMWCLWKERNFRTFEGKELSWLNLKFLFLKTLYNEDPLQVVFHLLYFLHDLFYGHFRDLLADKLSAFELSLSLSIFPCYFFVYILCTSLVF